MEKALDGKLREKNKPSGDKRLGVKKQSGRWTVGGEGAKRFHKKTFAVARTSLHAV